MLLKKNFARADHGKTFHWISWTLTLSSLLLALSFFSTDTRAQGGVPPGGDPSVRAVQVEVHNLGDCPIDLYLINGQGIKIHLGQVAPKNQWADQLNVGDFRLALQRASDCAADLAVPWSLRLQFKSTVTEYTGTLTTNELVEVAYLRPDSL